MRVDESIKKSVVDQLVSDDRLNAAHIQVTVDRGDVKLEGTVPSFGARAAATTDSWGVRGVTSVSNDLHVRFPRGYTAPTDVELMTAAREALTWSSQIDSASIQLGVDDGVVELDGTVDAYWKRIKVENLVAELRGVAEANNRWWSFPAKKSLIRRLQRRSPPLLTKRARRCRARHRERRSRHSHAVGSGALGTDRLAAYEAAANTLGVINVNNSIPVASSA